jgi:Ni/Fe-hydrogenase subunit HybB-like protein
MDKLKRLLFAASVLALLGTSLAGCYYTVHGPYPLVTFQSPVRFHSPYEYQNRDCRYYRNC